MPNAGAKDLFEHGFDAALADDDGRPEDPVPDQLLSRVMARLPQGSPGYYREVAQLVLAAWGDDALRARLRESPERALAQHGLRVPDGMRAVVVSLSSPPLPSEGHLPLPIAAPATGTAPSSTDEARAVLRGTEWRWLLEAPGAPVEATRPSTRAIAPPVERGGTPWGRRLRESFFRRPGWALAAGLAAVALWIWAGPPPDGGSLSGTATGTPPWPWIGLAVAIVAALIWWNGRRGL